MRTLWISLLSIPLLSQFSLAAKYDLDKSHTNIQFIAPHLMVSKVTGRFDKFEGAFEFDEQNMKLENVAVNIKTDSLNTNEKDRDKHLRSGDFFDVKKFPDMKFKSTKVEYDNGKPDKVHGELTIRGITKSVVLEVDYNGAVIDAMGNHVVSFEAETQVNRKDFGLNWNKALDKGGWVVGDEIKIKIDGEAKMAKAELPKKQ